MKQMTLTAQRLRELLHYDPETGLFTRLVRTTNSVHVGDVVAGSPNDRGYLQIRIDRVKYRSNRLAWMWMTGEWPTFEIDHRNLIKADNRWKNLRPSNRSLNLQNQRKALKNNLTGLLGVGRNRQGGFTARIRVDGKSTYLGGFQTAELAHRAYVSAKRTMHPGSTL